MIIASARSELKHNVMCEARERLAIVPCLRPRAVVKNLIRTEFCWNVNGFIGVHCTIGRMAELNRGLIAFNPTDERHAVHSFVGVELVPRHPIKY